MLEIPLRHAAFTLNFAGIAGFFGGEEAISAMATVHVYKRRKWLGWYNSPGSYIVGKTYGQLANSRFWDGLYPGPNISPANLLGLDGMVGPRYWGVVSGTVLQKTSHMGYLFSKHCQEKPPLKVVSGRNTKPMGVTVAVLTHEPDEKVNPESPKTYSPLFAGVPIAFSAGACVVCALFGEWICFSVILLGMVSSGLSCFVIGSGDFVFKHPIPSSHSPKADGMLVDDNGIVILKGSESAVNSITRGTFSLHYTSAKRYNDIGISSMALTIQFLLQLFLVPQGHLFGQIMFLSSLAVSWIYNAYLSSIDKEKLQQEILLKILQDPFLYKLRFPTWTSAVAFVMLALQESNPCSRKAILDDLVPNSTRVWLKWKETIIAKAKIQKFVVDECDWRIDDWEIRDQNLLRDLLGDAVLAYTEFQGLPSECNVSLSSQLCA